LVALIALSVLGQSIARQTFLESVEHPTLRALGMSPSQLVALGLVRAGLTGVAGAALAVLTAILLSPLTPIGLARLAEPSPGIRVDALVLAIAAGATVVATIAVSLIPILRAARASG